FTAVAVLPLAEATAVMEIAPLLVTVLAALVLNEHVGPRRWVGVAVGLIGALIVIRPGLEVFQPISLLLVVAAFCLAAYQIATRAMGGIDSIWTTMLYTTLFGTLASSAAMPWVWSPPPPEALLPLALIGVLGCAGHLCLVWALSQAQASVLAPFAYTQLVWATALGFLIFAEVPDGATILGGAVIVGAGLYVWHRERLARRRAEQAGVAASA
ncbi:MAG: DMT family transporter, partial [Pseudomonadota bacterium]